MRIGSRATAFLFVLLTACASPHSSRPELAADAIKGEQAEQSLFVLQRRAADYARVYSIGDRLRDANADLCRDKEASIGLRFETLRDYPRDFRAAAGELWHISERPSVSWLGEQATAAGVQAHDQLIAVNGVAVETGRNASRGAFNKVRNAAADGPVHLTLKRGEQTVQADVAPRQTCGYEFYMTDDDEVNAAADGKIIMVNRGLLRFVENDNELALVLGHELAHNARGHMNAMRHNAMMGSVGGAILDILAAAGGVNTGGAFQNAGQNAGAEMYSQEFEYEADYVGMYFMTRAGFDAAGVEAFWRRMAADHPAGIRIATSHPTSAARYVGLETTRAEILGKQQRGEPMVPNERGDHIASTSTTAAVTTAVASPATPSPAPTAQIPVSLQAPLSQAN